MVNGNFEVANRCIQNEELISSPGGRVEKIYGICSCGSVSKVAFTQSAAILLIPEVLLFLSIFALYNALL